MMTVKGLQIDYTYREPKLKPEQGKSLGMGLLEFKDRTTPRGNKSLEYSVCTP